MHDSSMQLMRKLLTPRAVPEGRVLDCGSKVHLDQDSYRPLVESLGMAYVGMDAEPGDNVDIVEDIYSMDLNETYDIVISGQLLEHLERPWEAVERMRLHVKPGGWLLLIAPFFQDEHRFPLDCWRLLPDGMRWMLRGMDEVGAGLGQDFGPKAIRDCWGAGKAPKR